MATQPEHIPKRLVKRLTISRHVTHCKICAYLYHRVALGKMPFIHSSESKMSESQTLLVNSSETKSCLLDSALVCHISRDANVAFW